MFGKVKQWLGIEGIKMKIELPEDLSLDTGKVSGDIRFSTMNTQQILGINLKVYERYSRGRRKSKKTSEYLMGETDLDYSFMVYPEEDKIIQFSLPYRIIKSEMDKMADRGGIRGSLAALAKKSRGVTSEYFIVAEAKVAGTRLNPFDKQVIVWGK